MSALALVWCIGSSVLAHPLEPSHVVIDLDARTLTTTHALDVAAPKFSAPVMCAVIDQSTRQIGASVETRVQWRCVAPPAGPLVLAADSEAPPVIVEVVNIVGTQTIVADAAHPIVDLTRASSGSLETALSWTLLGIEHLVGGLDHVALVLGLVMLIGLRRRLVAALTAFTLGHSLSLALGASGLIVLPSALVETAIAATLVVLALDLVKPPARASLFVRAPWSIGLFVGLVHGLGFAGVLSELGLPATGTALALVGFNVGLELAQLATVAAVALLAWPLRHTALLRQVPSFAGWVLGVVACAWVFERAIA